MQKSQINYSNPNDSPQEQYTPARQAGQATLLKRIGSTNYRVRVQFSNTSRETMNDKILRMVRNEAANE